MNQYYQYLPFVAAALVGYLLYQKKRSWMWTIGGSIGGYLAGTIVTDLLRGGTGTPSLNFMLPGIMGSWGLTRWLPWIAAVGLGWLAYRYATQQGQNPSWWMIVGLIAGQRLARYILSQQVGAMAANPTLVRVPILPELIRQIAGFFGDLAGLFGG